MINVTIPVQSGHTLFVEGIKFEDLPKELQEKAKEYKTFWVVKNWDSSGVVFMYLGKGYPHAQKQIVAWYANHFGFWSGYGLTLKDAIEGAQRDGWMYA